MSLLEHVSRRMVPQFTDLDFFALGYAVALVCAWHVEYLFRIDPSDTTGFLVAPGIVPVATLLGIGSVFCVYATIRVLFPRKGTDTKTERQFMLTIALAVMLFGAIVLYLRALTSGGSPYLIPLQLGYIAWLCILLRHVNDDGEHLHARMLVSRKGGGTAVVGIAHSLFWCSILFLFVLEYSWEITLALLSILSMPLTHVVSNLPPFGSSETATGVGVWRTVLLIMVPIGVATFFSLA